MRLPAPPRRSPAAPAKSAATAWPRNRRGQGASPSKEPGWVCRGTPHGAGAARVARPFCANSVLRVFQSLPGSQREGQGIVGIIPCSGKAEG